MIDQSTPIAQAAETYFSLGLVPIRLYGLRPDGTCACGNPSCKPRNAGKHPIGGGWTKNAPQSLDEVREQFKSHRGNIGVYLANKFILIDADGLEGLETAKQWNLPDTLVQVSGSGTGAHWIYRLAPNQSPDRITDRPIAHKVDVKVRGQFVAAPSLHASGNHYRWESFREPAILPDHLYQMVVKPARTPSAPVNRESPDVSRVRAYVSKMEPAISGQGGHNAAFKAACFITAQGLSEEDEWTIWEEAFNARCVPSWTAEESEHKLQDARRLSTREALPNRPRLVSVPADATTDDSWKLQLAYVNNRNGDPVLRKTAGNVVLILQNDPAWAGKIRKDKFVEDFRLDDPPWADYYRPSATVTYWQDSDTSRLQEWLIRQWQLELPVAVLEQAVTVVAEANEFNSARDWFDGLKWDGVERHWLPQYLGCPDTAYTRAVGRWWLISAVARVYEPGCSVHHMLILYGAQGVGKSSAAGILCGKDWFSDTPFTPGNKDAYLALQGKLIIEMAELEALNRSEATNIKSFLSSPCDSFRPPYARRNVSVPRRCVFIGTTNHEEMLKDDTGDRRFWPVTVGAIDRDRLSVDREQIWAEVVHRYKHGHPWYPTSEAEREMCRAVQEAHKTIDPWQSVIAGGLMIAVSSRTTVEWVLAEVIRMPKSQWTQQVRSRVAKCLRQLGWEDRNDSKFDGTRRRYYVKLDR